MSTKKLNAAITRARGVGASDQAESLAELQSHTGITAIDFDRLREIATSEEYEVGARLAELTEGQQLEGRLISAGTTEISDAVTGEIKLVSTYQFNVGGAVISILGSAQLDMKLPGLIGRDVVVARGGTLRTRKGRNVSEYFVASRKVKHEDLTVKHEDLTVKHEDLT
jgi:hypothetical protein